MNQKTNKAGVDRTHHHSHSQKLGFWLLQMVIVIMCAWITFFDGLAPLGDIFSTHWTLSDPTRAQILFFCALIYWLRQAITLFYLLTRKVDWSEVFGLTAFMASFSLGLLIIGGGAFRDEAIPINWLDAGALCLFLLGSYINSFSEIQRKWWKQKPESKGRCYTQGLFKYSMHANYFGDLVLFTGWCMFTQNIWTFALPIFMGFMFVFLHIPALDQYLAERYGMEFQNYAKKTSKLIPFIY